MSTNVKNTALILGLILFALLLTKFFNLSVPLSISNTTRNSEFAVTGVGKVDIVPDTANVSAGISVAHVKTAEEVEQRVSEVNNRIINALKALGVKKEDITTSNYSINPEYDYSVERGVVPGGDKIVGYSGSASVTIKVRDSKLASRVVQEATAAGANNVNVSHFSVEKPEKYQEQAREAAVKNAKEQAAKLSKSLGIRLGRVLNLVEGGNYGGPLPYYSGAKMDMAAEDVRQAPPEIEPGSQTVTATVILYFETHERLPFL